MTGEALVTGASGFLGRPLVAALADRGRAPRIAVGDLRDPRSYTDLLPRGGTVFHLAGVRNRPGTPVAEMRAVNVEATLELARRAAEAGVARFVHVGTALIYGPAEGGWPRTEDDPLDVASPSAYVRSKAEAVQGIRALVREGLPAVTVCPAIVFGPDHPSHPNRVTAEIRRLLAGGPRIQLAGGRQRRTLAFVDDVVGGLLAAEECGAVGEEYLLGGEDVSARELAERVLALAGARGGVRIPLPAGLTLAAARIADFLRGIDPRGGYAIAARNLLVEWRFSSAKARRDLLYQPLSLKEGLIRTLEGLRGWERR